MPTKELNSTGCLEKDRPEQLPAPGTSISQVQDMVPEALERTVWRTTGNMAASAGLGLFPLLKAHLLTLYFFIQDSFFFIFHNYILM